jgi:putative salt-induced outer membrane protein YdiY
MRALLISALILGPLAVVAAAEEAKPADAKPAAEKPAEAPKPPDEVKLKNGDRLTGTVKKMGGGKLTIETPHSGTVTVKWAEIASVKTAGKVKVRLATDEIVQGKLVEAPDGRLKVATEGAAAPVEVEMAKVTHLNEAPAQWRGNLSLAIRATDGNTHTKNMLAAVEAVRATEDDKLLIKAIFRYGKQSGKLTERNGYGIAKYNYNFYEGLYGYASVEFLSDYFKDLRLNTVVSVGVGYVILDEDWIDLAAEAGIAYIDNNFRAAKDESHLGARAAAHLRLDLPLGFEFKDAFTIYPNFEDSQDYQYRNEATLGTALGQGWSLLGGVITEYDNEPAPGRETYDNIYFAGLGYKF